MNTLMILSVAFSSFSMLKLPNINITVADILLFAYFFISVLKPQRVIVSKDQKIISLLIFFLIIGYFLSSLKARSPGESVIINLQYFVAFVIQPICIYNFYRTNKNVESLFEVYLLGIFLNQVISLLLMLTQSRVLVLSGTGRLNSLMGNSNIYAKTVSSSFLILLYLYFRNRLGIVQFMTYLIVSLISLVFASSFSGLLLTVGSVALYLGLSCFESDLRKKAGRFLLYLVSLVIALILLKRMNIISLPEIFISRILNALNDDSNRKIGNLDIKILLIKEAFQFCIASPIIGLGASEYQRISEFGMPVHNTYLLLWSEAGVLAIIGFISIVMYTYWVSFRKIIYHDTQLGILLFSMVSYFAMACMTNTNVYERFWFLPVFLVLYYPSEEKHARWKSVSALQRNIF